MSDYHTMIALGAVAIAAFLAGYAKGNLDGLKYGVDSFKELADYVKRLREGDRP